MRVLALIVVGFVLALVLAGIIGGGGSGRGAPDRGSTATDGAFADRIGLAGAGGGGSAGELAAPAPNADHVADASDRPARASPTASPWSTPAEFAPVDPIR